MERTLPRDWLFWPSLPRWVPLIGYVTINVALTIKHDPWRLIGTWDWEQWAELPTAISEGRLYDLTGPLPYVYSPLIAPALALIGSMGVGWWLGVNLASLALLRDRLLIFCAVVCWGFWTSVMVGSAFVLVFVVGALAYRGNRWARLGFLALCLLMPRPVQLPLAAWLLWQDRSLWRPFAVIFTVHAVAVLTTGYADDWVRSVTGYASVGGFNSGPTSIVGPAWLLVGIPLGIWLTTKGWVGWAGIAISPYVLEHYWLMPLIESMPLLRPSPRWPRATYSAGPRFLAEK